MMFRDIADLLTVGMYKESGVQYEGITDRSQVFCDVKSIGMQEFYLASQSDFSLDMMLIVRTVDYNKQKYVEYEGEVYQIIRTYDKGDLIELKCQSFSEGASKWD